jgi:DNA-binding SARP family transcriptional activator
LEGFYDDWALRERERLRLVYLKDLEYLMNYYKDRQDYSKSLAYGQKILEQDPLHEDIHREMMRLYMENGQRAHAVRQYQICQVHLAAELNIPPMEETQQLYQKILSETGSSRLVITPDMPKNLNQAVQLLQMAQKQVQQAVQYIQRFADEQTLKDGRPTPKNRRKHPDKSE